MHYLKFMIKKSNETTVLMKILYCLDDKPQNIGDIVKYADISYSHAQKLFKKYKDKRFWKIHKNGREVQISKNKVDKEFFDALYRVFNRLNDL